MAVVKDPGAEILGGDDLPEAAIDPNAPQIRVSHEYSKLHMLNISVSRNLDFSVVLVKFLTLKYKPYVKLLTVYITLTCTFQFQIFNIANTCIEPATFY